MVSLLATIVVIALALFHLWYQKQQEKHRLEEIRRQLLSSPHSLFPVCRGELDEIIGIVRAKEMLVALEAEAEIFQAGERRWLPICELFLGPGKSLLTTGKDLLVGFRFRASGEREATAFKRIMHSYIWV